MSEGDCVPKNKNSTQGTQCLFEGAAYSCSVIFRDTIGIFSVKVYFQVLVTPVMLICRDTIGIVGAGYSCNVNM